MAFLSRACRESRTLDAQAYGSAYVVSFSDGRAWCESV